MEETGAAQNPYRYAGYEYDKETKNYYLQSRYYNPQIARFLSQDTYRGDRKDPLSLNLYTYCHNEPIMYVDPDGHRPMISDTVNETAMQRSMSLSTMKNKVTVASRVLKVGLSGSDVKVLQAELIKNGYKIQADGMYGSMTADAVRDYQKKHGLAGNQTTASLYSSSALAANKVNKVKDTNEVDYSAGNSNKGTSKTDQSGWNDEVMDYIKDTSAYKKFVEVTQDGDISVSLGSNNVDIPAGFAFNVGGFTRDKDGVYHARQNWSVQSFKYAGYNNLYDDAFDLACDMDKKKFEFSTDKEKYVIWLWKGDYLNLGAGAETGIYYDGGPHWLIDKKLSMPMTLSLEDKDRNTIFDWKLENDNWWCTGFNPKYQDVQASNLIAKGSIDFSENKDLWKAFYGKNKSDPMWTFDTKTYVAKYEW